MGVFVSYTVDNNYLELSSNSLTARLEVLFVLDWRFPIENWCVPIAV